MTSALTSNRTLPGRVALVTGASRGAGAAIARAFSDGGAKVGLLSRSGDALGLPDALGGIATDFAMGTGRPEGSTEGMMTPEEVADTVVYCVTRPPTFRVLTLSYRPMNEASWG